MTDKTPLREDVARCVQCDLPDVDLRPVITAWSDAPVLLCSDCYETLDEQGKIDHEADAEHFGYAQ